MPATSPKGKLYVPKRKPTVSDIFPDFTAKAFLRRTAEKTEKAMEELSEAYRRRGIVLYIGAGVSRSAGLPGWGELLSYLTIRMMVQRVRSAGVSAPSYPDVLNEILDSIRSDRQSEKPVLMLARSLKDQFGDNLATEICRGLYRPFVHLRQLPVSNRPPKVKPLFQSGSLDRYQLLQAVASLARSERDVAGVQAIINYNYDDVLEEYLKAQKIRCCTVLSGTDRVPEGVLPSYHVHGLIRSVDYQTTLVQRRKVKAYGNFVFSEDEYHAEYSDPYKWSNMTQMNYLGRYTGLFIGLSMQDPNIRRLVDVTHRQYPDNPNYAVLPRHKKASKTRDDTRSVLRNVFEDVETESFKRIGVKVLWVDNHTDIPSVLDTIVTSSSA